MAMQRPCWTVCLCILWVAILPALLYTHIAVGKLAPAIGDLPTNLAKGFDIIFGFASLEADSIKIKNSANTALGKCGRGAAPSDCGASTDLTMKDVAAEQAIIAAAFANSLNQIKRVTEDPYLGQPAFASTNANLQKLLDKQAQLSPTMQCAAIIPVYCDMHSSATAIVDGVAAVNNQINAFKQSDAITVWKDNKGIFTFLHALPYALIIAMLFFTFFWYMGGICCCSRKGTKTGCWAIPCFLLFLLLAFIIWTIIAGAGTATQLTSDDIKVPVLRGEPSLQKTTQHFETKFPKFWSVVFKDLYDGLVMLLPCSYLFFIVVLAIFIYACCLGCCNPYKTLDDEGVAPPAPEPEQPEPAAPTPAPAPEPEPAAVGRGEPTNEV